MKFFEMLGRDRFPWTDKLVKKLANPEYRHEYVAEGVRTWIARQIRVLREQRGWSQGELGDRAEKPQSAISRLEDPDYGKLSLQTLFDLAKAYDVALIVKFVDYPTFIRETKELGSSNLTVASFEERQFARLYGIRVHPVSPGRVVFHSALESAGTSPQTMWTPQTDGHHVVLQ